MIDPAIVVASTCFVLYVALDRLRYAAIDSSPAERQRIVNQSSKICVNKKVSLLSLAEQSGMDLKRLQAIYLGRWTPSANERAKIAQALDTPKGDIARQHSTPVEHFYGPC